MRKKLKDRAYPSQGAIICFILILVPIVLHLFSTLLSTYQDVAEEAFTYMTGFFSVVVVFIRQLWTGNEHLLEIQTGFIEIPILILSITGSRLAFISSSYISIACALWHFGNGSINRSTALPTAVAFVFLAFSGIYTPQVLLGLILTVLGFIHINFLSNLTLFESCFFVSSICIGSYGLYDYIHSYDDIYSLETTTILTLTSLALFSITIFVAYFFFHRTLCLLYAVMNMESPLSSISGDGVMLVNIFLSFSCFAIAIHLVWLRLTAKYPIPW